VIVQPLPGNGLGSMMNDARDPKRNNCRFQLVPDSRTGQINLVVLALRLIYPGEELFVSYGHGYWKSFEDEASDNVHEDHDDAASEHSETSTSSSNQAARDSNDEQDAGSDRQSAMHLHVENANDRDALAHMKATRTLPLNPIRIDRTMFHEYAARISEDAADEFAIGALMEKCIRVWSPSLCCFVAAGSPMPSYSRGQAAWRRYCRFLVRMAVHFNESARELLISACLELCPVSPQSAEISTADPHWKWLLGAMNASNDWAASIGVTVRGLVNSHFNKQTIFTGLSSGDDSNASLVLSSVLSEYCKASSSDADSPETRRAGTSQCSLCSDEFLTSATWSPAAGCSLLHRVMPLCSSCEKKLVNVGIRNLLGMSSSAVNESAETPQSAGSRSPRHHHQVLTNAEPCSSQAWTSLSSILARSLRPCCSVDAAIALIPPSAVAVSSRLAEIWRSDAGIADATDLSSHLRSPANSKSEATRAQEEPEMAMTPPYLPEWDPLCPHCMQAHVDRFRWIVSDEPCSDAGTEVHMESFADVLTLGMILPTVV
jgi:hypothetical protein